MPVDDVAAAEHMKKHGLCYLRNEATRRLPSMDPKVTMHDFATRREWAWRVSDVLFTALSLWLASGRRMRFLDATFDDALFARLANSLRDGHWLGAYDKLTLAKVP